MPPERWDRRRRYRGRARHRMAPTVERRGVAIPRGIH